MTNVKVDKGIPMPRRMGLKQYPFDEMEVGDSFEVSVENLPNTRAASSQYGARHFRKFSTLKHDGAYRCWRVE